MSGDIGRDANYYLSPHPFFFAVNRGCRSRMYCSSNDRSKNRVKKKTVPGIKNFSQPFPKSFSSLKAGLSCMHGVLYPEHNDI